MTKHSPGPWRYCQANPEQGCSCGLIWSEPYDMVVAQVIEKDEDHTKPHEAMVANAKLIAASPEYYDLIEEILTTELNADVLRILQPWLQKAERIHAKATQ